VNPCTCPDPTTVGLGDYIAAAARCPHHGPRFASGPRFKADGHGTRVRCPLCHAPQGTPHATFCKSRFTEPEPERSPEGVFEGMSRAGLSQLADEPVGTIRRINGHDVWRWEESSPITRILSDGRPEGTVDLHEAWLIAHNGNLNSEHSPLRRAVMRWAGSGRTWWRDEAPGLFGIRLTWRTEREEVLVQVPDTSTELTTYMGAPL
jgi:hypothetical protein